MKDLTVLKNTAIVMKNSSNKPNMIHAVLSLKEQGIKTVVIPDEEIQQRSKREREEILG